MSTGETINVLVADDDLNLRTLMGYHLEHLGMGVTLAANGREAIGHLPGDVDVVLLDMRMPEMDGMECLRHIREHYPELPCIIVTAYADVDNAVEAMRNGAFDYVVKPMNLKLVTTRVEQAARSAQQTRQLHEAEAEKERLIEELQKALAEVRALSGFLPICSYCKKIRDDRGYWNQIEAYIAAHSEAEFTHSMCPECTKVVYAEIDAMQQQAGESDA